MDSLPQQAWRGAGAPSAPARRAMVLSGGVALGAFEAGAYAALEEAGAPLPDWFVGASVGALNAAIIAGNPPGRRVEQLRRFWESVARDPTPATTFLLGPPARGAWRKAYNEAAALQALLFGRPGLFRPRLAVGEALGAAPALYDLEPLRERLPELLDFDRLNSGETRLSVAATDVVSGERVVFDTERGGARIGPEHIAASCALLPIFAPVEIEGRLLGDGGLASNAPVDLVLDEPGPGGDLLCFVVELFALRGRRPDSLGASAARAADLAFGGQTRRILDGREREHRLRALLGRLAERLPPELRTDAEVASILGEAENGGARSATVLCVGYRAPPDQARPGDAFDFSPATLSDRWDAGARGMREALRRFGTATRPGARGLEVREVEA